ncbi:hypothetical protein MMC11_008676 [Xylographa trunciseda]|nr:hypothetical protein [Xylographa trunciseda]
MSASIAKDSKVLFAEVLANRERSVIPKHDMQPMQAPKSLLLEVPAELRLMIHRMVLCSYRPLSLLLYGRSKDKIELLNKDVCPSILLTCKLFNQEGTCVLYSENTFAMSAWCLSKFANKNGIGIPIGSINAGSIKSLKIQYDIEKLADLACDLVEDIKPRLFVLLRTLPGLEEIVLYRYEEADIAHMKACCMWHRPATTNYFLKNVATTSLIFIAALQDIIENQLKDESSSGEPGYANLNPKIYITQNQAALRLAMKGKSLRMKNDVSAPSNSDVNLLASIWQAFDIMELPILRAKTQMNSKTAKVSYLRSELP